MDCSTSGFPSITTSRGLLKLMYIESVMPSNPLILCCPLLVLPSIFPSIRVFSSESVFASGNQSIGASVAASVLLMNIQDWFPSGLTGLVSLQSKGLARVFSSTIIQKHQLIPIVSKAMFSESGQQKGKSKCPWPSPRWDQRCPNKMAMSRLILPSPLFSFFQFANIEFRASDNVLYLRES